MIVSPEASLASMACVDGYIAQIWTGTSREPNYYNGVAKERVFETAFLEYGSMESMTAPTGRKIFFLTDKKKEVSVVTLSIGEDGTFLVNDEVRGKFWNEEMLFIYPESQFLIYFTFSAWKKFVLFI